MIVSDTDTGLSFNASSFTGTSQKKGLQHQGSIQMSDGSYQSQMTFGQGEAETGEGSKGGSAGTQSVSSRIAINNTGLGSRTGSGEGSKGGSAGTQSVSSRIAINNTGLGSRT